MVNSYLAHHGVLGMKWGVRRYQNKDGTLKEAAYKHYGYSHGDKSKKTKSESVKKSSSSNSVKKTNNDQKPVAGVQSFHNADGTLTAAGRKRYGINENGYMSKEGKKLFEADHAEGVKKAKEAGHEELVKYLNNSKGEGFKIDNKQDLIERRYKDTHDFIKMAKRDYNESYEMVVNKYGDVSLKSLDQEAAKGYEVVKSMEDIYKKVKLSDIR